MDFKARFNSRRHCDVKVQVEGTTFYLHRFPLEAKSTFFDERFGSDSEESDGDTHGSGVTPPPKPKPARPVVELQEFPGGAPSFEAVARCVGGAGRCCGAVWCVCVCVCVCVCLRLCLCLCLCLCVCLYLYACMCGRVGVWACGRTVVTHS